MNFTDIFIRRPVFATVLSLLLVLVGARSYFALQTRLFPKVDASAITITTTFAGADAELMEGFVTTPIENALGGVDGIDYITSSSQPGASTITIYFTLGYDLNAAMADVNAKINIARKVIPKEVDDPIVSKVDPNATPTIYMTFYSNTVPTEQVTDYLIRVVQPQLQTLPGVGSAQIWGVGYGMKIWLNPQQMSARNVTATDILQVLLTQSVQAPSGQLKSSWQQFNVKTYSEATTQEQFNQLVIRDDNGTLTRIQDVGHAELGPETTDVNVNVNGKSAVVVAITPSPIANPLDITAEVNKLFPQLLQTMPPGIHGEIMWDSSKFISESIKEVKKTIVEATLCVIFVVFLFIGSWRTLLIPAVTIPISLISVCGIMLAMGYSLNTITFLSLVLAIGMVVDDAIVVSENIHRHLAEGKSPFDAAIIGAREIQFAIIAMTFTLAAVYAPIGFLTGFLGSIFKEFAFTLASAVVISGFIALTLSPMMCSKIITGKIKPGSFADRVEKLTEKITEKYRVFLTKLLTHRKKIVLLIPVVLLLTYVVSLYVPSELAPIEDGGAIIVPIIAPTSANIDYTTKYTKYLEPIYNSIPEKQSYLIVNGAGGTTSSPNTAYSVAILKPWSERKRGADEIIASIFPQVWSIPGIFAFPLNPPNLPGVGGKSMPIDVELQTIGDYQTLNRIVLKLAAAVRANPKITNVDTSPKIDQPQLDINIDRNKAGDLGISVRDIGETINLGLGQPTVAHFSILGRSYDVIPEILPEFSNQPDTLNNLYLRTAGGDTVPLSNLVSIKETTQPQSISHFQQLRSISLTATTAPGYTIGQALDYIKQISKDIVPSNIRMDYGGFSRMYLQTSGQMLVTFIFAIIFIFLVLAAQFESFRDPLIVLFTIPLSSFGAFLGMWLAGCTLNIYSEIGLVTLIGLISKHGILMVEFANQLQETGKSITEAITTAAAVRLRPILMTTGAMVLGAIPLAFAHGASAISRQQIGWVIIGGMSIGTIFTLFMVPTIYTYLATKKTSANKE
ncbi:MAG: efflux RND transporter permease subunit [Gammaproteobacteria bacterium]|nr:efflux RND transporter permease subunit [Gammaproteobacteria bacterium]